MSDKHICSWYQKFGNIRQVDSLSNLIFFFHFKPLNEGNMYDNLTSAGFPENGIMKMQQEGNGINILLHLPGIFLMEFQKIVL